MKDGLPPQTPTHMYPIACSDPGSVFLGGSIYVSKEPWSAQLERTPEMD